MKNRFILGCAILALAACSSGPRGPTIVGGPLTERERERLLPPEGDPGMVAATDIAFAKAAREDGQWTAFRRFADDNAVMHLDDGVTSAAAFLTGRADPEAAVHWVPQQIWSSCDGSLSVTTGRFQQADGLVGSYITAWKLQSGGEYRWTYDMGAPDDPQPQPQPPAPAPAAASAPGEDLIVVPGLTSIDGKVADCLQGSALPPAPLAVAANTAQSDTARARDGTLQYRWEHGGDGSRRVVVDYVRDGAWQQVLDFAVPAPGTE